MMMFLWVACWWHPINRLLRFYYTYILLQVPYRSEFTQSCKYKLHVFQACEALADHPQNFNIPIQIQPQVFCVLALICWAQILTYSQ